jgi:hypothetical protein
MGKSNALASTNEAVVDRRKQDRPTLVFRIGLLETEGRFTFCLLRNISPSGVQVKLYSPVSEGSAVRLRVGDEEAIDGRVVWVGNGLAGIAFKPSLDATTLLRVQQMDASQKRRTSPRAQASGFAIFRTGGREYSAKLADISTTGAKIVTARSIDCGGAGKLAIPGLPSLLSFVRWTQGQDVGLTFQTPMPIQVIAQWLTDHPIERASYMA